LVLEEEIGKLGNNHEWSTVFLSVTSNYLKTCFNSDKTSFHSLIATSAF